MRKEYPNLLVFCGSGQNVGKTTLIKAIIEHISINHDIVAIKVSPHTHTSASAKNILWETNGCRIIEENEISSKDSSLFMQAGANPVFYVETNDSNLENAFMKICAHIGENKLIICESGALARYFKPGILVYVELSEQKDIKDLKKQLNKEFADLIIHTTFGEIHKSIEDIKSKISVVDGKWELIK